jgi:hypothetical protein
MEFSVRATGVHPLTDVDGDSWSTARETYVGTDPEDPCGFTAGPPLTSESWPPDLVETNNITIQDVLALKPVFGQASSQANARYDLMPGNGISIQDVLSIKPVFGTMCTS